MKYVTLTPFQGTDTHHNASSRPTGGSHLLTVLHPPSTETIETAPFTNDQTRMDLLRVLRHQWENRSTLAMIKTELSNTFPWGI